MRIIAITSGYGGDFFALMKAQKAKLLENIEFHLLISTDSDSMALKEAKKSYINYTILDIEKYSRERFDDFLEKTLVAANPDLICLCGFKYILNNNIVSLFSGRIINSHPSLLPAFPGLVKKETMLSSKTRILGATIHIVDEGVDTGAPIIQAAFPNPGMKDLGQSLNLYRYVQNIIYVQAVRNIMEMRCSNYVLKKLNRKILFNDGIMFYPPIDEDIIRLF